MTQEQCRNIAAGFMHALTQPALYAEWMTIDPDDAVAFGKIMQREMALLAPPTREEMLAMDEYIFAHMQDEVEIFLRKNGPPPQPGFLCFLQQDNMIQSLLDLQQERELIPA